MTSLVACISEGKGTWTHVQGIIEKQEWEKIFLLTNQFGMENFKTSKQVEFILIDSSKYLSEVTEEIRTKLLGRIKDTEVAVNFVSGSGKEHMAILSALLKLGLGIRLVVLTLQGVKEL